MPVEISPIGVPVSGTLLHSEGEAGYVYDDWTLSETSRSKMIGKWPALDLPWIDLAAKQFASAWSQNGSNRGGFVGWRDDIKAVSSASAKLLKALQGCAFPARHSFGMLKSGNAETALYEHSVAVVTALIDATGQLAKATEDVDARRLPHPMPELIIQLAQQLRFAGEPWDKSFNPALVSLTTMTLDGLGIKHALDIRSSVKDVLKSGDRRLKKLR